MVEAVSVEVVGGSGLNSMFEVVEVVSATAAAVVVIVLVVAE